MLFDRLVFPMSQVSDLRYDLADAVSRGPVVWSRNPAEWARWESQKWNPGAQESLLELLEPVVRNVPWDVAHQEGWRKEFSQKTAETELPGYAFVATRSVLTRDLPMLRVLKRWAPLTARWRRLSENSESGRLVNSRCFPEVL